MILSTLLAATVAAQPAPPAEPTVAPAPVAEKKMACCDKMAKGEGCECCKGMDGKTTDGTGAHAGHAAQAD